METYPYDSIVNSGDYQGKILNARYSPELKYYISEHIHNLQAFDETAPPVIPYLSAWQEKEQKMWYEFVGQRFGALMDCDPDQVAENFRNSIIERRVYNYKESRKGAIATQTLKQSEISHSRNGLRKEGEQKGLTEAVYKLRRPDGEVVWLKDQATVKSFKSDNIHVSSGCLTLVTKEMEAEEALIQTQKKLRENARELQRARKLQEKNTQKLSQAVDALETAKKSAETANRAKSEFLAVISHEIRNPMNGIIGTCDLIMDDQLSLQQNEYLDIIKNSAISLLGLINDILDFSKIEAGKMEFLETPFDIRDVIEDVSDIFLELVSKKRLELVVDIHPDVPARVLSDPMRLRQILINLTSNALKFTKTGEIIIRVEPCGLTDAHAELKFHVRDTGIGIAPEHLPGLFDSFTQINDPLNREYGGTGLGLAISRQIVEMMNGTIGVESTPGKGSTFHFTAPYKYLPPSPEKNPSIPRAFHGANVLIAVDNTSVQGAISRMLRAWGFAVTFVHSARGILEKLSPPVSARPAALVIADMGLKDLNDDNRIHQLKTCAKQTPFIATLNMGRAEEAQRAVAIGITHLMTKPVKQELLLHAVKQGLGHPAPAAETKKQILPPGKRFADTRILIVEDNAVNLKVGSEMLRMAGVRVDTARNGLEAVEKVEKAPYDAMLIDIQMPHLDGIEASRIIRENRSHRDLPIIAMSAHSKAMKWAECEAVGINDYIVKPFSRNDLFTVLNKQLTSLRVAPTDTPPPGVVPLAPSYDMTGLPGLDIETGIARLGGSRDIYAEIMEDFCETHADFAQEFKLFLTKKDFQGAATLAHSIKGAAGNISAHPLFETMRDLEEACWNRDEPAIQALLPPAQKAFSQMSTSAHLLINRLKEATSRAHPEPGHEKSTATAPGLLPRMQALRNSLKDFDPIQSDALVSEMQPLMDKKTSADMDRLARHVKNYQFDEACKILETFIAAVTKQTRTTR